MKKGLLLRNIRADVEGKTILKGVNLEVLPGSVHAIMGPNGGGKSTLAQVVMGHPAYSVPKHRGTGIFLDGKNVLGLPTQTRAVMGMFLAFQSPVAVPGVSVMNLLRAAYTERSGYLSKPQNGVRKKQSENSRGSASHNPVFRRRIVSGDMPILDFTKLVRRKAAGLGMDETFLTRGIHDGFSGGEKKKIEMLQAIVLKPEIAIFDEIDTGLDVDALRDIGKNLKKLAGQGTGVLIITHYTRILSYVTPDRVSVLAGGKITRTGDYRLARKIEKEGYLNYLS